MSEKAEKKQDPKFTKVQLLQADRFKDRRDQVEALLVDGEDYTLDQVDDMIKNYMEGGIE